ncbi:hypothetical protein HX878_18385 [Pseudomonas veronii]|uniref:hypothetical protein n=1 Tax=Pseudomonas veronii TaxID=76761 RepID=UPI0015A21C2F|nr:hypothetical protein [Pseudomonas veronii]NWD56708.1 hypothetical protein [Pseudomonas veronii]
MTEFQRINALLVSFRASMRNKNRRAAPPAKRDQADVLRVRYWYEGLRHRTGLATAYKLEQHFEPESFRKQDGITSNRCKWQRYAAGRHTLGIPCALGHPVHEHLDSDSTLTWTLIPRPLGH